jgi:hypothetical protein
MASAKERELAQKLYNSIKKQIPSISERTDGIRIIDKTKSYDIKLPNKVSRTNTTRFR